MMTSYEKWVSYKTIVGKDTRRALRLWIQTLLPSVVTTILYFIIFGYALGAMIQTDHNLNYATFIAPGLVMLAMVNSAFSGTSFSFFLAKFNKTIDEIIISPTPLWLVLVGYMSIGIIRGIITAVIVGSISWFFTGFHLYSFLLTFTLLILTGLIFSCVGVISALYSDNFDQVSILPNFVLTPLVYLGGVFYSISQGMPAGVAAVVTSLQPVLVSIVAIKVLGEKLVPGQVVGLGLGLAGVFLVLGPTFDSDIPSAAIWAIVVALIGSTSATLLQKKVGSDIPLIAGTAYQYLFSGAVLGAIAIATGNMSITWNLKFTAAFIWLVVVLSVGAILLLLWLLNSGSAASVSSLLYLVPPATAIEAFFLFGEKVNTQGLLGIGVTALGVWLVIRG
jgi:drug/metabolite transporter (DMT)-like permease